MTFLFPYIISGIATGAVYGLAATGLVLTYKTTGVFNFAHGAIAAAGALLFYSLTIDHGWHWVPALIVSVPVLGAVLGLFFEVLFKNLARQRTAYKIVGTVGVVLVIQGLSVIKFGHVSLRIDQYLPHGTETFRFANVNISYAQVIITCVAVVSVGLLYLLFYATRTGLAMRAVVDDPGLLSLHGTSPRKVRLVACVIGSTFAALSGVLVAPQLGIDAIILTYLVVQAFGAAAIGGFSNIPVTFLGGVFLGILASVSTKYVLDIPSLKGLPQGLPFIILIVVLVVLPKRRLQERQAEARPQLPWVSPLPVQIFFAAVVTAVLLVVPSIVGTKLPFYTIGLTQGIMLLSLGLLVRTAGLVSLGHAAFGAIGAVAFAQFVQNFHMPWLLALVLGALVVVPIAAVLALPAIRLSGIFLALATLGFGLMVERMFYTRGFMFTSLGDGRQMSRPSFASSDRAYYYVCLVVLFVAVGAILALRQSRLGRVVRGMAESPIAVTTLGLNANMTRTIVFCVSGFFAGLAGILYGASVNFAVFGDAKYSSFYSLLLLATVLVVPFREPWYALFAAITAVIPAYWQSPNSLEWINVIFGVFAVLVSVQGGPHSMPHVLRRFFDRFGRRRDVALVGADEPDIDLALPTEGRTGLEVRRISMRFGGHTAVHQLSLAAPRARITGLIGPNGAGKTTTFNVCSGLLKPSEGTVVLHGNDVTALGSDSRARQGLGRTFQVMQLCDSLTVEQNVLLGAESGRAGRSLVRHMWARPFEVRHAKAAARQAMRLVGIEAIAGQQAGALSTGQRRLVELARCLSGDFDVLLLDEPSSGLDNAETMQFGHVLQAVVAQRGCGILLVEHDMKLVMEVCEYIYVLDFGELLFEGTPREVAGSSVVQAAYLGSDIEELRQVEVGQL